MEKPATATVKITPWENGKPMSTAINKATTVIGGTDFDEETWLVEPPNLPAQSNSTQGSGRIAEWLQTRSALSRKLTNQAARKKKRAEKLNETAKSISSHRREHLAQVQEELVEMNQSYGDGGDKEDLKEKGIISKWSDNRVSVMDKKLNKQRLAESCGNMESQKQQHEISGVLVSSLLSLPSFGNMTMTSDGDDDNDYVDDDNDENDEFYDASSDFNDVPLSSAITTTVIDTANVVSSQNDSRDKVILNGGASLAAVNECIEPSVDSGTNSMGSLTSNGSHHETRQVRQTNTARISPIIAQNVVPISRRSSLQDKSKSPYGSTKSHSPSVQLDLKDIKSIVERQEAELREELSRLKSTVQDETVGKTLSSIARKSQVQSARSGTTGLMSSKSIEFGTNGAKLSAVTVPSPVFHASRLPTPVRKSVGRSLIPTPRASALSRSAIRGLAGGSTPSLVLSQHIYNETHSECGGISHNEQRWADECF
ncbi:hypothetical protein DINM_004742 [Dirofilaria immitis]|nr:hypothetical protein [Dirofilaria immitis]